MLPVTISWQQPAHLDNVATTGSDDADCPLLKTGQLAENLIGASKEINEWNADVLMVGG
ncbi:MAG: hypothetical protein JW384_00998 [Nitrosomonadaceae bacterium]|nr:hypothetical protein [Nitrosomonadaceae bacterium]